MSENLFDPCPNKSSMSAEELWKQAINKYPSKPISAFQEAGGIEKTLQEYKNVEVQTKELKQDLFGPIRSEQQPLTLPTNIKALTKQFTKASNTEVENITTPKSEKYFSETGFHLTE